VGRRNVGKSTFINALAETERMIVSEVAGTTRDSVDIRFHLDDKSFVAIDTPGVRKKKSLANSIEFYGLVRAQKSIRRANVVLMFFDATDEISRVDKKLVDEILERSKACIFVVNKWDLGLEMGMTTEKWADYLFMTFASLRHVPVAFITAKDSKNIKQLINLCQSIYKQSRERVGTGELNRIVDKAQQVNPPRYKANRRGKIFYATQVATEPPTIVMKCNDPKLFDNHWKRYLLGRLREELPFKEVPLKVYFRGKEGDQKEDNRPIARKRPARKGGRKGGK
ncbi:MAG: 50S ribosome-binding GTPase, partial [Planctomycetaceae bacterium]|nr:50S ribosome-binding GTPase [Planctomycetaceae bacterium]